MPPPGAGWPEGKGRGEGDTLPLREYVVAVRTPVPPDGGPGADARRAGATGAGSAPIDGAGAGAGGRESGRRRGADSSRAGLGMGIAEYGDPDGLPVLFFHGWPGSRYQGRLAHEGARRAGLRLLAVDRPGFGRSDPLPGLTLRGWAGLTGSLVRTLGLRHWGILAVSGGGPHALACRAARLPGLRAIVIACGAPTPEALLANPRLPPGLRLLALLWRRAPALVPPLLELTGRLVPVLAGPLLLRVWALPLPAPDREVLRTPRWARWIARSTVEAFRQGGQGPYEDVLRLVSRWDFDPAEGAGIPVHVWYGLLDTITDPHLSGASLGALPGVRVGLVPGEAHYSLAVRDADVLAAILGSELRDGSGHGGARAPPLATAPGREGDEPGMGGIRPAP